MTSNGWVVDGWGVLLWDCKLRGFARWQQRQAGSDHGYTVMFDVSHRSVHVSRTTHLGSKMYGSGAAMGEVSASNWELVDGASHGG